MSFSKNNFLVSEILTHAIAAAFTTKSLMESSFGLREDFNIEFNLVRTLKQQDKKLTEKLTTYFSSASTVISEVKE